LSQGLVSILAPPLSVVFLAGAVWKRSNNIAAEVVLYGGGFICLILGACHVLNYPYKGYWPHFLLLSFYTFLALGIVMIIISLFTRLTNGKALPSIAETNRHIEYDSKKVWSFWGALAIVMVIIYLIFN
jgi:SSS family solute:Na+ symporter